MTGGACTPLTPFSSVHSSDAHLRASPEPHYFQKIEISDIRRQHNQDSIALDTGTLLPCPPIDLVPNEILSLIFELGCLESGVPDLCFRGLIEKVSSRWREAAHRTPSLWSVYRLSQGNLDYIIDHLPVYLERSADYPLEIHLNCFWDPARTDRVMKHFLHHSKRWRLLSVTTPTADIFRYLHGISVPRLEDLQICHFSSRRDLPLDPNLFDGHLPSLRHLTLRNMSFKGTTLPLKHLHSLDVRGYGVWPDRDELNEFIGGSTTLGKLALHVRPEAVLQDVNPQEGSPIILPALHTFDVVTSEWLSPQIATLCRAFSCPSMESFSLRDSSVMTATPPYDMVRYLRAGSASHSDSPLLRVRACSLYHAWRCLNSPRNIVTLELDDVRWSHWSNVMTVFASLPSLENVIITNVEPTVALSDLGAPCHPFRISSLKKLEVGVVKRKWDAEESDFARFVRVFDVPALRFLAVRNISGGQWCQLLKMFTERTGQCLELESLTVTNLQGGLDACPDPTSIFPNLASLSLIRVPANSILKRLVSAPSIQWPNLKNIAVCGDPHASTSLLHRIIASRPEASFTLYLDGHFQRNLESWNWLEENAEVILMPTIDLLGE